MDEGLYIQYFEEIATNLKAIGHTEASPKFFFIDNPMDLQEVERALKNLSEFPILLLDNYSGTIDDGNSDNTLDYCNGAFTILAKANPKDHLEMRRVKMECSIIGQKIIAKMRKDRRTPGGFLKHFKTRVSHQSIGPIFNNLCGKVFEFEFANPIALEVKPEDWL